MRPNVRPDAGDPGLGGSAEPVAPPPVSENQATRALALALADGFRAKGLNTVDVAAALIREHDELVEENARLTAEALARAPQGDPPEPREWPEGAMLEAAWGLIANANEGDWEKAHPDWYAAAVRWRDAYHRLLDGVRVPAPQGDAPEHKVLSPEHRAANEESFKQSGLDWCAHQMAYNWPRNRFGSLLTEGEYEALVRGGASSSGSASAGSPPQDLPGFADSRGIVGALADVQDMGRRGAAPAPPPPDGPAAALERLAALEDDWDSYGAHPFTTTAVAAARKWLSGIQVIPTASGRIMLGHDEPGQAVYVLRDGSFEDHEAEGASAPTPEGLTPNEFLRERTLANAPPSIPVEQVRAILTAGDRVLDGWGGNRHEQNVQAFHAAIGRGVGSPQPAPALQELLAALEPLLDNAEGYDKSNVRSAFLHTTFTGAWTREQLLAFEERARAAWKALRSSSPQPPEPQTPTLP